MNNRLLLIIDPQIDFITGALPVPDAEKAMDALAEYLLRNNHDYTHIIYYCYGRQPSHAPLFVQIRGR